MVPHKPSQPRNSNALPVGQRFDRPRETASTRLNPQFFGDMVVIRRHFDGPARARVTRAPAMGPGHEATQRAVDGLKPGERRFVWDDTIAGFAVRVTEGAIAYVVDFEFGGRRRRVTIGATQLMSVAEARDRAQQIIVGARQGDDLTVNPRRGMPTFGEVWRRMIDDVDKPTLAAATIDDYEDRAKRLILPKLSKKLIGDVTAADVDKVVAAATGQRNRAYIVALIKKTVNFAKRARILGEAYRNPAAEVAVEAGAEDRSRHRGRRYRGLRQDARDHGDRRRSLAVACEFVSPIAALWPSAW